MKEFTKAEIEQGRKFCESNEYPEKKANLDNRSIDYFIMPQDMFKGIPNGLFRMTGKPSDGYVVGVSDEVPKIIQPHFAMTEHDEFMVYGLKDPDSTLHSEQYMLNLLENEKDLRNFYSENKIKLYDYMLRNTDKHSEWLFTPEDTAGFSRALDYLSNELKSGEGK